MIKALSNGDDPVLILGLSDENWRRLRAGRPIALKLDDLRPGARTGTVVLLGGPDEASLIEDLRAMAPTRLVQQPEPSSGDQ